MKADELSQSSDDAVNVVAGQRLPWPQILLCFGLFATVGLVNGAIGVQLPYLRDFYRLDNTAVGLLYGGETLGYALAAFLSGGLVARFGLRLFGLTGLVVFGLSCLLLVFAPPFLIVLLGRAALGFGMAIMESGSNLFVAILPRRTALLNYLHALFGLGSLLGPLIATALLTPGFGWNSVYLVWLIISLPLLVGCLRLFPKRAANDLYTTNEKGDGLMRATLRLPVVWSGTIFLTFYVGLEIGIGAWAYTFLTEARLYEGVFSGWAVSGYWAGLTLGRIILVPITERLGIGNRGLIQLGLALAGLGILIIWWWPGEAVNAFGLIVLGLGVGPIFPTLLAILAGLVAPRLLASTIGFATSLSIIGAAISPALAGAVADKLGLGWLMPYFLLVGLLTFGVWVIFQQQAKSKTQAGELT